MAEKTEVAFVRLKPKESATIKRAALRAGKPISVWARELMLAELDRLRAAGVDLDSDEAEAAREVA